MATLCNNTSRLYTGVTSSPEDVDCDPGVCHVAWQAELLTSFAVRGCRCCRDSEHSAPQKLPDKAGKGPTVPYCTQCWGAGFLTPGSIPACHLGFGVLSVTDHTVVGNKAIHSTLPLLIMSSLVFYTKKCVRNVCQLAEIKTGSLTKEVGKKLY